MNVADAKREYIAAKETTSYARHQEFIRLLLSSDDPEMIAFHFDLLEDQDNWDLYQRLRAAFKKRGTQAEEFLVKRIKTEPNPDLQGDALHLLGGLKSKSAAALARDFALHTIPDHREKACYVLGWVGTAEDIDVVGTCLLEDREPQVRATAATALDQLRMRVPRVEKRLLAYLKNALERETDEEVTAWIIITIQYVTKKKFGLKEDIDEAVWTGDVGKAKNKALKALSKIV